METIYDAYIEYLEKELEEKDHIINRLNSKLLARCILDFRKSGFNPSKYNEYYHRHR